MNITLTGDLTITICGPFDGKLATTTSADPA